ncbi:MAG TPA: hypothetical protein VNA11_02170, partial [Pseudonocardia sp.]|nr:hypothetical protein [Pseudonocardia sp.]
MSNPPHPTDDPTEQPADQPVWGRQPPGGRGRSEDRRHTADDDGDDVPNGGHREDGPDQPADGPRPGAPRLPGQPYGPPAPWGPGPDGGPPPGSRPGPNPQFGTSSPSSSAVCRRS